MISKPKGPKGPRILPPYEPETLKFGDRVVAFFDPQNQVLLQLQQGKTLDIKQAHFSHANFVGRPYGCKILSNSGCSFVFALKPDRSLYTANLTHRTQILYSVDMAFVVSSLNVKPGSIVVESGTGSGSLSFTLMRALGGKGHLFSFEYNKERAEAAQAEFAKISEGTVT